MSRQPGSATNAIPRGEDWVARELTEIKRRLDNLMTGRSGNAMTIDGAPGVTIQGGGGLQIIDPSTGTVIFQATAAGGFSDGSDRKQGSTTFRRANGGTAALVLADLGTALGHPFAQALQWFDPDGHIVVADDLNGNGLARPYIPASWADITVPTNTTASTSYAAMAWSDMVQQHPQLRASILCQTPAGTAGSIRMTAGGVQIGSAVTVPANTFGLFIIGPTPWPAGTWNHESFMTVQLEAKVTSGAGAIGVRGVGLWGIQA